MTVLPTTLIPGANWPVEPLAGDSLVESITRWVIIKMIPVCSLRRVLDGATTTVHPVTFWHNCACNAAAIASASPVAFVVISVARVHEMLMEPTSDVALIIVSVTSDTETLPSICNAKFVASCKGG